MTTTRRLPLLQAFIAILLAAPAPAMAGAALDKVLRPPCRSEPVCRIEDNPGGDVALFELAAGEVLAEGKRLVIDGRCDSACVVLADLARANTCLTQNAEMEVHQASVQKVVGQSFVGGRWVAVYKEVRRENPPESADVNVWVADHGGYPVDGFMLIPLADATQFWPMCE